METREVLEPAAVQRANGHAPKSASPEKGRRPMNMKSCLPYELHRCSGASRCSTRGAIRRMDPAVLALGLILTLPLAAQNPVPSTEQPSTPGAFMAVYNIRAMPLSTDCPNAHGDGLKDDTPAVTCALKAALATAPGAPIGSTGLY